VERRSNAHAAAKAASQTSRVTPITGARRSATSHSLPPGGAWRRTPFGSPWKPAPAACSASSRAIAPATSAAGAIVTAMADRTFAKFTFFKIDPEWRRRDAELRAADKQEFLAACDDFALDRSLRAYSTIGTRGDVDLVLLSQSPNLDDLHTFHVVLGQSGLAKWADTPHSFLSMTKRSPYSDERARPEICVSERKYLFLYPMVKQRRWYGLPAEERGRIMKSHIEVGRRYPEITINTSYSFGLDDQEFVVAFEGDDPGMFLDLVNELRPTESSEYTERETPIFTCVAMSVRRALDALDGTANVAAAAG
jgi:chlorite dismutase